MIGWAGRNWLRCINRRNRRRRCGRPGVRRLWTFDCVGPSFGKRGPTPTGLPPSPTRQGARGLAHSKNWRLGGGRPAPKPGSLACFGNMAHFGEFSRGKVEICGGNGYRMIRLVGCGSVAPAALTHWTMRPILRWVSHSTSSSSSHRPIKTDRRGGRGSTAQDRSRNRANTSNGLPPWPGSFRTRRSG